MKQLLLLRHAKSSWDDPDLDDFDRPLAERGLKAARLIGRELAARDWLPDLALVSPALRTRDTWRLVASELPAQPRVAFWYAKQTRRAAACWFSATIQAWRIWQNSLPDRDRRRRRARGSSKSFRQQPSRASSLNTIGLACRPPG
ncbi:histidine phosphatase family protein [Mesorhizobium sp. Cs1321R2N1]